MTIENPNTVKVVLLRDHDLGQCGDIIFLDKALLPGYSQSGLVCASPGAIEYAETGSLAPSLDVKVRLTRDCEYGQCNDVVFIDSKLVPGSTAGGVIDTTPEGIAYAESLKSQLQE